MHGKPKKGANKKALKCYSCGKLDHFARDCRLKNIVSRLQINIIKAIIKKDKAEVSKSSPKQDDPVLNIMLKDQGLQSKHNIA